MIPSSPKTLIPNPASNSPNQPLSTRGTSPQPPHHNIMNINPHDFQLDRSIQKATLHAQYQHILDRLDQRLRRAIDRADDSLIAALREEQYQIQSRLS